MVEKLGEVGLEFQAHRVYGDGARVSLSRVETSNGKVFSEHHLILGSTKELEDYLESDPYRHQLARFFFEVLKRVSELIDRQG